MSYRLASLGLAGVLCASCGGNGSGNQPHPDGRVVQSEAGPFVEAAHPPLPRMQNFGGGVMQSPKIVTVVFGNDPNASYEASFDKWYVTAAVSTDGGAGSGSPFPALIKEYGGGAGQDQGLYHLPATSKSSLDDSEIRADLLTYIGNGMLPPNQPDSLYMFFLPGGVGSTAGGIGTGCVDYYGYHDYEPTTNTAYAVIPQCTEMGLSGLDELTEVASHEISEAATDPFLNAWYAPGYPNGGETGDLCLSHIINITTPVSTEGGFIVQREFSNAAADAESDPCVPSPFGGLYYNVAPETMNVTVNRGSSTNISVVGFSNQPLPGPMTLLTAFADPNLTANPTPPTFDNGTTGTLTITASAGAASGDYILFMYSYLSDWNGWNVWVHVN
jgi:hypothetical protein